MNCIIPPSGEPWPSPFWNWEARLGRGGTNLCSTARRGAPLLCLSQTFHLPTFILTILPVFHLFSPPIPSSRAHSSTWRLLWSPLYSAFGLFIYSLSPSCMNSLTCKGTGQVFRRGEGGMKEPKNADTQAKLCFFQAAFPGLSPPDGECGGKRVGSVMLDLNSRSMFHLLCTLGISFHSLPMNKGQSNPPTTVGNIYTLWSGGT